MSVLSDPEFIAIRRVAKILEGLDFGQRRRVLEYAASRYVQPLYQAAQQQFGGTGTYQVNGGPMQEAVR